MFTITSNDFPTTASQGYGVQGATVEGTLTGTDAATYQAFQNPSIEVVETVTVPAYDDVIVVTLPTTTEGFSVDDLGTVEINSTLYIPSDDIDLSSFTGSFVTDPDSGESVPSGTYTYDPSTLELRIYPPPSAQPEENTTITYTAVQDKPQTFTDAYTGEVPRFFKRWNIYGEMSFEQSLGQSPSGSLQFLIDRDSFDPCDFEEGTDFIWDGNRYGINSISTQWNPLSPDNLLEVSLSLGGPWDYLMDDQVRFRGRPTFISTDLISHRGSGSAEDNEVDISFSNLCNRAGLKYIGPDITIRIDANRDKRDSTTIGSELGRARSQQCFAYLSNPRGLEFREWFRGRNSHRVGRSDILNGADGEGKTPISIQYNLLGNKWKSAPLAQEYRNTRLNVDRNEGDRGENGRKNVYETKLSGSAYKRTTSGGVVIYLPPSGIDRSVPTANFDVGGPTKDFIREEIINGVTVSREKTVHGYAYKCSDFATWVSAGDAQRQAFPPPELQPRLQGWGQVLHELEEYEFDADGYLIRIKKTVTTKRRFKQETEKRESLLLNALSQYATSSDSVRQAALRASHAAALSLYDYFDCTEIDVTTFTLSSLEDIYPEMPPLESGKPQRKYVSRMERSRRYTYQNRDLSAIAIDEDGNAIAGAETVTPFSGFSVDLDGLTVATGIDYDESMERSLIYPYPRISKEQYDETRDHYQETTHIRNASGEAMKNVDAPADVTQDFYGKVSIAQRLEIFEEGNDPNPQEDSTEDKKLLLNTPNSGVSGDSDDPIDGSVSFPSAYTESSAKAAAVCDISIANTKAVEVWANVLVVANRRYEVGDVIRYRGDRYRVLSVSDRPSIQDGEIRRGIIELSWGREVDLRGNVSVSEVD